MMPDTDSDGDINADVALDYGVGNGDTGSIKFWYLSGWLNDKDTIRRKWDAMRRSGLGYVRAHTETIMYGQSLTRDRCHDAPLRALLPAWMQSGGASVLVNGRPIVRTSYLTDPPAFHTDTGADIALSPGRYIRVGGMLALDCHGITGSCNEDDSMRVRLRFILFMRSTLFRTFLTSRSDANLTGVWAGSDGGTYYVHQVGNNVWWLGLSRDQGLTFANVFAGRIRFDGRLEGDWADVPLGATHGFGHVEIAGTLCVASTCDIRAPVSLRNRLGTWPAPAWGVFAHHSWFKLRDEPPGLNCATLPGGGR